ncbi:MAG: outer membrane lipoprotein-sorting protein [Thermodesulfobacteriota bacterium]|nr:outer membrane lipoprotein-sorting protein [Thermodesulfobacteriota bacterium]
MKYKYLYFLVVISFLMFSAKWSFGFEDCFNHQCTRQDNKKYQAGWEMLKAFESDKNNLILENRWPTVNLRLTHAEERARFGTTGLEVAKRAYLLKHYDGTNMRMLVFVRIVRSAGERKIIGWRPELNPAMPKEYLDPSYPEEKKRGLDWKMLIHWVHPPDIRGTGILIYSYNNKKKDQDTWVWFPSLRKVRRLTPSNGDDSVAGSYKTFSEAFLRRIPDEVPQIIGETMTYGFYPMDYLDAVMAMKKYGVLSPEFNRFHREILQPRECWVIRADAVKGGYCDYYKTRIWLADKEWGYGPYIEEIYNSKGKLTATHFWPWKRISSYDGKVIGMWDDIAEDLNFEEKGFSHYAAPQTNYGYDNPESWFTLRELKRSIPTVNIPYMLALPPKKLMPIEDLFPTRALQEAYQRYFPERITSVPGVEAPLGLEEW